MCVSRTIFSEKFTFSIETLNPSNNSFMRGYLLEMCAKNSWKHCINIELLHMSYIHISLRTVEHVNMCVVSYPVGIYRIPFTRHEKHGVFFAAVIYSPVADRYIFISYHSYDCATCAYILDFDGRVFFSSTLITPFDLIHKDQVRVSHLESCDIPADNGRHDGYTSQNTRGCVYPFSHILPLECCVGRVLVHFQSTCHKGNSILCGGLS